MKINKTGKNWTFLIKSLFTFYFTALILLYVFVDDGGWSTKVFLDFVFIPIPSFMIASILTALSCGGIYLAVQFCAVFENFNEG